MPLCVRRSRFYGGLLAQVIRTTPLTYGCCCERLHSMRAGPLGERSPGRRCRRIARAPGLDAPPLAGLVAPLDQCAPQPQPTTASAPASKSAGKPSAPLASLPLWRYGRHGKPTTAPASGTRERPRQARPRSLRRTYRHVRRTNGPMRTRCAPLAGHGAPVEPCAQMECWTMRSRSSHAQELRPSMKNEQPMCAPRLRTPCHFSLPRCARAALFRYLDAHVSIIRYCAPCKNSRFYLRRVRFFVYFRCAPLDRLRSTSGAAHLSILRYAPAYAPAHIAMRTPCAPAHLSKKRSRERILSVARRMGSAPALSNINYIVLR